MKKVKFIYNPYSGENEILDNLDKVIEIHQSYGYTVVPYRISKNYPVKEALEDVDSSFDYVLIAGGDGTVDSVVNAIKARNIDMPIGILPVGTANDFAKFIGIPQNIGEACVQILENPESLVDIGRINDKYFINVASTGLFTDISQKTDDELKNTIGKLAYYIKGIGQLPNFRKLKVKLTSKEEIFDGEMYLMLVFNGQTAGNLKLATKADVCDGKLDVIVFKALAVYELLPLFIKMLKGEHLDDPNVLYFKTDDLLIESNEDIAVDIDGEKGPGFPLTIQCIKGGLKIRGIKK